MPHSEPVVAQAAACDIHSAAFRVVGETYLGFPEIFMRTGANRNKRGGCYGFKEPFPSRWHGPVIYSGLLASPLCFTIYKWEDLATSCLIPEPCLGDGPNL